MPSGVVDGQTIGRGASHQSLNQGVGRDCRIWYPTVVDEKDQNLTRRIIAVDGCPHRLLSNGKDTLPELAVKIKRHLETCRG